MNKMWKWGGREFIISPCDRPFVDMKVELKRYLTVQIFSYLSLPKASLFITSSKPWSPLRTWYLLRYDCCSISARFSSPHWNVFLFSWCQPKTRVRPKGCHRYADLCSPPHRAPLLRCSRRRRKSVISIRISREKAWRTCPGVHHQCELGAVETLCSCDRTVTLW